MTLSHTVDAASKCITYTKFLFTPALARLPVSEKSSLITLILLPPTAPLIRTIIHDATNIVTKIWSVLLLAEAKRGKFENSSHSQTLVSASVNRP